MPQSKMLVDTNSYLRLAQNIRPFLAVEFGPDPTCLYVLAEAGIEIESSHRLTHKFFWALEEEHVLERRFTPSISRKQKKEMLDAFSYIWEFVLSDHPGPSKVDATYLAYGHILQLPVVTDDRDMRSLAKVFDIKTVKTLELMKHMFDVGYITLVKVNGIVDHWRYINDIPADLISDIAELFPPAITATSTYDELGLRP
ncbi:DNA-binding protein [Pseudomonas viridiflava]|uniref:DNA-binding protein n=1 Tax=Pseudomonas viridiflava TaxID=33069 RepID=UPI00197BA159|nr:DNA-binding protein [Pseudomonas viridiflava]